MTGGAGGIGAAPPRRLHAEGAAVVVADVRADRGRAVAASLGDRAAFVELDVTDADAWTACAAEAEERFGPVSVLVNNAGIVHGGPLAEL